MKFSYKAVTLLCPQWKPTILSDTLILLLKSNMPVDNHGNSEHAYLANRFKVRKLSSEEKILPLNH